MESLGFKIVQSYYDPNLIKTDCPAPIMYQLFQSYKKLNFEKDYFLNVKENSFNHKILSKKIEIQPKFYEVETIRNIPKYLQNPFPNWGPKSRTKLTNYFYSTIKKYLKKI